MSNITRRIMWSLVDRVTSVTGKRFSYVALGDGTTITGELETVLQVLKGYILLRTTSGERLTIRDASRELHPRILTLCKAYDPQRLMIDYQGDR